MLDALKNEMNKTFTENGAVALSSTGSECLDLFATIGALRNASDEDIIARFIRAYAENPDLAMKLLFFARDIREGLGERQVFRTILRWIANNRPKSARKNIDFIAEFGRYDDLLSLIGTECEADAVFYIKAQFEKDMAALENGEDDVSLLGKWLPSVNASSKKTVMAAKKISKALGLSYAEYRKALSALRAQIAIIENNLRTKDYTFDYEKQTSGSLFKYRKAFSRNDNERYAAFLNAVATGKARLNASNIVPHEIVRVCKEDPFHEFANLTVEEIASLDATWKSLPDYSSNENILAVVDGSGSMYADRSGVMPIDVSIALGLYLAEHNTGVFRDHFITFSRKPEMIKVKGDTIVDKVQYIQTFDDPCNTDIMSVFEVILDAAIVSGATQKDMPSKIVVISDMEFDFAFDCPEKTVFENAKAMYEDAGYKLPEIVFWNVNSRGNHQPVTMNEMGVTLVSGSAPKLFEMIAGGVASPYEFMLSVLADERYALIAA